MERRELSEDILVATEAMPREAVALLERFAVGDYWQKSFPLQGTSAMMEYVGLLRQEGLDIGKGNSQFGYRMPLPEKDAGNRYLQIFRRR